MHLYAMLEPGKFLVELADRLLSDDSVFREAGCLSLKLPDDLKGFLAVDAVGTGALVRRRNRHRVAQIDERHLHQMNGPSRRAAPEHRVVLLDGFQRIAGSEPGG